ncbi:MAG: Na+/H+ antiporter NhaA [Desulfitobacteriaceae bacterium]|nr:Na+/H+ antiporter NhaA [Desulfitobacteriaceae bacterium]
MRENTYHLWRHLLKPVSKFIEGKMLSSVLLLMATFCALIWANSPFANSYYNLWHINIELGIGNFQLSDTLGHWINDGLMVIFFFVIGLEIKREFLVGELSTPQKATLPIVAALGGMIVPALIYTVFNVGGTGAHGWGIPMATDIAFALGCIMTLGGLIPLSAKVFLLALAIVDDLGAILVIALFYTDEINLISLIVGIIILSVSWLLNRRGVRHTYPYAVLGIALWAAFLFSGIHATIAGVLLALTIPARAQYDKDHFKEETRSLLMSFPEKNFNIMMVDETQKRILNQLKHAVDNIETPLQKLEDALHPFASYFIIPIFALANAGVNFLDGSEGTGVFNPITIGIILGLFMGKQLGITFFAWVAVKAGIALLPEGVRWSQIWGISCVAGIGFTMSLFITNLAFGHPLPLHQAKIGILCGSMLSAVIGISILLMDHALHKHKDTIKASP